MLSEKKKNPIARWFGLYPAGHIAALFGLAVIGAYFALRGDYAVMTWLSGHAARPWHRFAGRLCDGAGFSVAAVLIAAAVVALLVYIIFQLVRFIRRGERLRRLYRLFVTLLAAAALIYAGFCLLWGVYYYTSDFEEQSGIRGEAISTDRLETVTKYFAGLVNSYGAGVARDADGLYAGDMDACFARSSDLYGAVEQELPCLAGESLHAKPFLFSKGMSLINFTGFFFPFTGEANINTDAPACLIPATIAHELAHQRGVAQEDEANFVAVLASLESGDADFCYSASLLAYIHLGNALYAADRDAWQGVWDTLSDGVKADIANNNAYWAKYNTAVSKASDKVYTGFLESYGQTLGLKSYGACVDLLAAYYYDAAVKGGY